MRTRESIYTKRGYAVAYIKCEKARGFGEIELCIAKKGNDEFVAIRDEGWYTKIYAIQDSIPHMAKFSEPENGHILMQRAPGKLLWDIDAIQDIPAIEKQLIEFAVATKANNLAHRDVRPWNVFLHDQSKITVIDWNLSRFLPEADHGNIDLDDTVRLVKLMKGEITFYEAWKHSRPIYPAWCRH